MLDAPPKPSQSVLLTVDSSSAVLRCRDSYERTTECRRLVVPALPLLALLFSFLIVAEHFVWRKVLIVKSEMSAIQQLPENWEKQRLLIWSGDRLTGGSTTDYVILVNPAFKDVVYVDWVSCSVPGYFIQIEELPNNSLTTNNRMFWRFVYDLTNTQFSPMPDALMNPGQLRKLSIHWRTPAGAVPAPVGGFPEHTLELEVWIRKATQ